MRGGMQDVHGPDHSLEAFAEAEMIPAVYQMSITADRDVETITDTSRTALQLVWE